jgi:hypothetical protein
MRSDYQMRGQILAGLISFAVVCLAWGPLLAETAEEMTAACSPFATAKVSGSAEGARVEFRRTWDSGLCWGAFSAIQGLSAFVDERGRGILHACVPPESTRTQLIAVFLEHVRRHPEQLHLPYDQVAINALVTAFPCQ